MCSEENSVNSQLFEEIVSTYYNANHLMYKKMERVLEHIGPRGALIDVGCGIGEFIVRLKDRFHTLVGVDISPPEIEYAKKRLGKYENVFLCPVGNWNHFAFKMNILMSVYVSMFLSM